MKTRTAMMPRAPVPAAAASMTGEVWRGLVEHHGKTYLALLGLGVDPHPFTLTENGLWGPILDGDRGSPLAVAIYLAAMADPEAAREILAWDPRWREAKPTLPFPPHLLRPARGTRWASERS